MKTIKKWYAALSYKFRHWCFVWVQDHDGDFGVMIARCLILIKYKEHTMVYWRWPFIGEYYAEAPKYVIDADKKKE